jgi:DNA repair exonuclease SbcCD ATPase subunit
MPIDRDSAFREANGITQAELATLNDFRAKLVNDVFPASLFGLNPDSNEYEELIDKVLFDGMTKGDIETYIRENQATRKSNRFEPSPEEEFVLYRFEDKSKRSYVVDATGTPDLTGDFSPSGQANNQSLHYGKEVTFQKGDVVMIDKLTADGYQRADQTQVPPFAQEESVTEVSRIYKRKLADFPRQLEAYRREAVDFAKRADEIKIENDKTQKALDATQTQEQSRDEVISMLQQDRDNLKSDAELISKLLQERNSQAETLKNQLETVRKELDAMKQKVGASLQLPNQPGRVAGR